MFKTIFNTFTFCFAVFVTTYSQSVGIGTATPNSSAILDVSSTSKGILLPRMNTSQRNAIVGPIIGLQIFNLDDQCTDIFDGTNWIKTCGFKQVGIVTDPEHLPNSWVQKSNFTGLASQSFTSFSIGSKAYVGTGYIAANTFTKEFWEYDAINNSWTQKANFGGTARYGATGFSIGLKGYIGTGRDAAGVQSDFWEYNSVTNLWTQKANFGGIREGAIGFSIGNMGYIGTGNDNVNLKNDFWEYNPSTNLWTEKANFGGSVRTRAFGFGIGSKGYIGPGYNFGFEPIDMWEYNPTTNTWIQKANFPGGKRESASSFVLNNSAYVGTGDGVGGLKKDFWQYNPLTNNWIQKADVGGLARRNAFGFSIGNKGYIGSGYGGSTGQIDLWEYMDDNSIGTKYNSNLIPTLNNVLSDGAWTIENNSIYNSNIGNIGIGTTNPVNKLSVEGYMNINGFLGIANTNPQTELDLQGMLRLRTLGMNVEVGQTVLNLKNTRSTVYVLSCTDINGCSLTDLTFGIEGRIAILVNKGPNPIHIINESLTSIPEQRVLTGTGNTATIKERGSITFRYDGELSRWTILSSSNTEGLGLQWKQINSHISNANTGNVGIGVANPTLAKLMVKSNLIESNSNTNILQLAGQNPIQYFYNSTGSALGYIKGISNRSLTPQFSRNGIEIGGSGNDIYFTSAGNLPAIMINGISNNVGIGTNTPSNKLSVNGSIRAKEVIVELANWPDYVFDKKYDLKPLPEIEKFILKNKHLPNIPTASIIEKEGLMLGETQKKMMEKIEELTLYMIELNKSQEVLILANEVLKKEIEALKRNKNN